MDKAPRDILLLIFPQLDGRSLARTSSVCKHWNVICSEEHLWEKLLNEFTPLRTDRYKFKTKAAEYGFRATIEENFRKGRAHTKLVLCNAESTTVYEERTTFVTSAEEYKMIAVKRKDVDYGGSYGPVAEPQGSYDIDFCEEQFYHGNLLKTKFHTFDIIGNYIIDGYYNGGVSKKLKWGEEAKLIKEMRLDQLRLVKNSNPSHRSVQTLFLKSISSGYNNNKYVPVIIDLDTMQEVKQISNIEIKSVSSPVYYSPYLINYHSVYDYTTKNYLQHLDVYSLDNPESSLTFPFAVDSYTTNGKWLVLGKTDQNTNTCSLEVISLSNGQTVRNINVKETKNSYYYGSTFYNLYVDNHKIIALAHSACLKLWDVNNGQFLCSVSLAFAPTLMRVVDGKVLVANSKNVGVAHFDRPNMDENVGMLVIHPGKEGIVEVKIQPGEMYEYAMKLFGVNVISMIVTRYWYKSDLERIYIVFCKKKNAKDNSVLQLNNKLNTKSSELAWQTSRFLPLAFTVDKEEKEPPKERVNWNREVLDIYANIGAIYGPILVFSEKKTNLGDWMVTTLTKDHFEAVKKKMK